MQKVTRLRHVSSKDVTVLEAVINNLPFKVEIKGNPVRVKGKWFLFFILPEDPNPITDKFISRDLD